MRSDRIYRTTSALLAGALIGGAPLPAGAGDGPGNVDLPRHPALSPDGERVVFSWRGDLWSVSAGGGAATRLTSHPADELASTWSPDGKRIAFVSHRDGFANLWVMRADGTALRQVTDSDIDLRLGGFGVDDDGAAVLTFDAALEGDVYRSPRPYQVALEGGALRRVHDAFGSQPRVSPDGRLVLFTRGGRYSGWERRGSHGPESMDLFVYDRDGETFRRLTAWRGNDGDGRWGGPGSVLFMSERELDTANLYRMDAGQGEASAERLTDFRGDGIAAFDASAGGAKAVMLVWDTLYTLDLTNPGAEPVALSITAPEDERDAYALETIDRQVAEAALSPDGQVMAYVARGEVYVRNVEDGSPTRRVTDHPARERDVAWSADGVRLYFTSDRDGTDSIYAATVALSRGEVKDAFEVAMNVPPDVLRRTGRTDRPGRAKPEPEPAAAEPGAAPGDAARDDPVSGVWDGLAEIPEQGAIPFTLTLRLEDDGLVTGDLDSPMYAGSLSGIYTAADGALALTLAVPDGPLIEFALVIENGTMSGEASADGNAVPLSAERRGPAPGDHAGQAEPDPGTPPDDEADEPDDEKPELPPELDPDRWHDAIRFDVEPVVLTAGNDRDPRPSPDGRVLSFRRGRGDVVLLDLEMGSERVLYESWDTGTSWRWSPDSRWIAWARADMNFNSDVFIAPADGSAGPVNVTRHPDDDLEPRWSADGRILSFASERVNEEFDLWMVFLDKDLEALTPQELEQYFEDAAKAAGKRKPPAPRGAEKSDADADEKEGGDEQADAEPESEPEPEPGPEPGPVELELDDAWLRVRRVTRFDGDERGHLLSAAGDRLVFNGSYGERGLYSVKWDGSDRKRLTGPVDLEHLALKGSRAVFVGGRRGGTVKLTGSDLEYYDISDRITVDLERQASQKFLETARVIGEQFYHPDMKGVDWPALTKKYHELARRTRTHDEFAWVGNRLLGELTASHLGVRPPSEPSALRQRHGRLGTRHEKVELDDGRVGFAVLDVVPESPADQGAMALRAGDVIVAIEGEPFAPADTAGSRLTGRIGKETLVTVVRDLPAEDAEADDEAAAREVELHLLVTPISFEGLRRLEYRAWRRHEAALVHEWSDGRLGYIHIEGMGQGSLDVFERDLFAAAEGRDGLIIDVRNNGGGWTTDRLLASIMVRPHAWTIPRGADPEDTGHYPQDRLFIQRYTLPMNLLCNEKSFSNAEIMSHAFKTLKRGTLVGQETWGGVISTGGFTLIDGTRVRLPFRGWYVLDGTDMENHGAVPDIIVEQTPEAEAAGRDDQLRAAVDDLLGRLADQD